jgi:hypothetical protein
MTNKKLFLSVFVILILAGGITAYVIYNMPHRDVQATNIDFETTSYDIVEEFLSDYNLANSKYLDENGESKIILVEGIVKEKYKDKKDQVVIVLGKKNDYANVSCTFMESTNKNTNDVEVGSLIKIKGVIRSGASFDEDMELYEDVIIEKCNIIK